MSAPVRHPVRRWVVPLIVILLIAGWWIVEAASGEAAIRTVSVRRDDLVVTVEVTGTLHAVESSVLATPTLRRYWNYKIAQMAPEGVDTTAGTPVLRFDTTELEQRLLRRQAETDEAAKQIDKTARTLQMQRRQDELRVAEAAARRRKARLVVDRPGDLSSAQELAVARLDLELADRELAYLERRLEASERSARATLAALTAQRERAEQEVEEIRRAIDQMTRRAPRDGTVIYVMNWQGQKNKVGDTCWRGQPVIEVPDLSRMKADGQVDEENVGKLREGQPVSLRLDAHPDVRFRGEVVSIGRTVERKTWSNPLKVARLEIALAETDTRRMRPGMRYRGEVEIARVADALLVPIEAVFSRAGGPVVYRKSWLGVEEVSVELGRRNARSIEVTHGLEAGDRLSTTEPADS